MILQLVYGIMLELLEMRDQITDGERISVWISQMAPEHAGNTRIHLGDCDQRGQPVVSCRSGIMRQKRRVGTVA
ncbi:hypothetical protein BAU07_24885 [Bordetella flabilis]|uniref:Uncharacterized protein n=1 Tax=Bordetella flabilis TaxID=463014 RepID=A0A193GKI0_9BORD|nr:hypothetical protein BAU07_24885 [Bordetella flabilis]